MAKKKDVVKKEVIIASQSFEGLKQHNEHGAEYWSARDLQPLLGYSQWGVLSRQLNVLLPLVKSRETPLKTILPALAKWSTLARSIPNVEDYHLCKE